MGHKERQIDAITQSIVIDLIKFDGVQQGIYRREEKVSFIW